MVESGDQYLSKAFDSIIIGLLEFVKMEHHAGLQTNTDFFLGFKRLSCCVTKKESALQGFTSVRPPTTALS